MKEDKSIDGTATLSATELELRRYEARLGVWKVVLGTFIIGLAGILIPGAINFYNAFFENSRKEAELRFSQQAAYQQYIKDFFSTAINQDIELRIRFADYFAHLAGSDQKSLWGGYLGDLKESRDVNRAKIDKLEQDLVELTKGANGFDVAKFNHINREIAWARGETGYAPTERNTVVTLTENSPAAKKTRLYKETADVVQRLSTSEQLPPGDLGRFWDLYSRELIGVESSEFAQTMIEIGNILNSVNGQVPTPPQTKRLQGLSTKLLSIAQRESPDLPQTPDQPRQQK